MFINACLPIYNFDSDTATQTCFFLFFLRVMFFMCVQIVQLPLLWMRKSLLFQASYDCAFAPLVDELIFVLLVLHRRRLENLYYHFFKSFFAVFEKFGVVKTGGNPYGKKLRMHAPESKPTAHA